MGVLGNLNGWMANFLYLLLFTVVNKLDDMRFVYSWQKVLCDFEKKTSQAQKHQIL